MEPLNPVCYHIRLEPDLERFVFTGSVEIEFGGEDPSPRITLDSLNLSISRCSLKRPEGFKICRFSLDPDSETLTVDFPEPVSEGLLRIEYTGPINEGLAGFYRSRYTEEGVERTIAVTQFQESDARRAFPCMDRPEQKARFDIEMVVARGQSALSNTPVLEQRRLEDGKQRIRFQETPKMSTYLVFFAVGDFDFLRDSGPKPVRVLTMPGLTEYADFGLVFGRKALDFCEDYFGVPYPLEKLDLIAIPDFAFGAMENWGAITFRENLLLHYPGITSRAGEVRICEVISHEIVHQWFGNLVTPADWKYLWLNESFATYFGYRIVDHYHPEWEIWEQFLSSQTATALDRDGLKDTVSLEIPGGNHVVINTSTAPIIYNKGASILRQIEGFIGEEAFRKGLGRYLQRHRYGCASSHHLWDALESASESPVTRIMKSWIEQPGHPLLSVTREGRSLHLNQERFSYLPNGSDQKWLIPVTVRAFYEDGTSETLSTLMEGETGELDIGDASAYKVNDGHRGFYRVQYGDSRNLDQLLERVSSGALSPEDRWGIESDLFSLFRAGRVDMDTYLDALADYAREDAFLPLSSIREHLFHTFLLFRESNRQRIAAIGRPLFEGTLERIGYEPAPGEKLTLSVLRDQILLPLVHYGSKQSETFAGRQFELLMGGGRVHPDIRKSVLQVGALSRGEKAFEWLVHRMREADSEHERMNLLNALGAFRDKTCIEKALQYILDRVPDRNKFVPIVAMGQNPHAIPLMWDWYRDHVGALEELHPLHYERVIAGIVPVGGLGREAEVEAFFTSYGERTSLAGDAVKVALERLRINAETVRAVEATTA